jgi:mRNA interferase MazF
VAGGKDYAGKRRPCVIIQDDRFDATNSVTVCGFSTDETEAPLFRLRIEPNEQNGLRSASSLMVDKINAVPRAKLGRRIGLLDNDDMTRVSRAILVFLGLVGLSRAGQE